MKSKQPDFTRQKGFTLAELLIVVAIVAVLVAISMPIFASRLEKSRESTDMANMRSAKATVAVALIEEKFESGSTYYYDAERGTLIQASDSNRRSMQAYGKGTTVIGEETNTQDGYEPGVSYDSAVILVSFRDDRAYLEWVDKGSGNRLFSTDAITVGEIN